SSSCASPTATRSQSGPRPPRSPPTESSCWSAPSPASRRARSPPPRSCTKGRATATSAAAATPTRSPSSPIPPPRPSARPGPATGYGLTAERRSMGVTAPGTEDAMARLIRMDQTGHTTLAEWTAGDDAAVEAAVAALREQLDAGYYAVVSTGEGQAEQV